MMSGDSFLTMWNKSPSFVNKPTAFVSNILKADHFLGPMLMLFLLSMFFPTSLPLSVPLCNCAGEAETQPTCSVSALPSVRAFGWNVWQC